MALAGTTLSFGAVSGASASVTMYNTWDAGLDPGVYSNGTQQTTDGWTWNDGKFNGTTDGAVTNSWAGTAGAALPLGYTGKAALNWAIQLDSLGDSGTLSRADALARYGVAADLDTAQGAWQDSTELARGWRHGVDFGLIVSDVTQTIRLRAETVDGTFPSGQSTFGISVYQGMDSSTSWSHHGAWHAGYIAGDTSAANLALINGDNPIGTSGLTFVNFSDASGLGPYGNDYVEFTALAGQVYTVILGGRAGVGWSSPQSGYSLSVQAVPVPAAVWLLGSALAGMGLVGRRRQAA